MMKAFNNSILLLYSIIIALVYSCGDHSSKESVKQHADTTINTAAVRDSTGSTGIDHDSTLLRK